MALRVKQPLGVNTNRTSRQLLDLVMERISGSRQAAAVFSSALILPIILHLLAREEAKVPSKRLILGVLSARDHFSQREAIRQTWGSAVRGLSDVEMKFVLGDQDCSIHPADRISPYGCDVWHLAQDLEKDEPKTFFKAHHASEQKESLRSVSGCFTGLGFRVLHPVIIERFMVPRVVIKGSNNLILKLSDPEEVHEEIRLSPSACFEEGDLCSIKLPYHLKLPRGFEGELSVVSEEENEDLCELNLHDFQNAGDWVCDWNNNSVIEYKFLRMKKNILTKWHKSACPLVSAKFTVADRPFLTEHRQQQAQRTEAWMEHLADLQAKVEEEQSHYQDLLLLPHLDVYTYLSLKVMFLLRWATYNYNFSYVMKVDDDTLVNVSLLNLLVDDGGEEDHVWWSLFNHHHSVPFYGKWADLTYPSLSYPTFPAGSGYLMTRSLVKSLVDAHNHLVPHGGEDVSMGIWVSSVCAGARHIDVPCWLPHARCPESVLVPQLSVQQMVEMWQNLTHRM